MTCLCEGCWINDCVSVGCCHQVCVWVCVAMDEMMDDEVQQGACDDKRKSMMFGIRKRVVMYTLAPVHDVGCRCVW